MYLLSTNKETCVMVHELQSPFGDHLISNPTTPRFPDSHLNFIINIIQNTHNNELSIALRDIKQAEMPPISKQAG